MTTAEEVAWCEGIWNMIRDGGSWAVPRSGLIFEKQSTRNALVLIKRMPHEEGMPITARRLREQQDGDVSAIRQRFALLGIGVLDEAKGEDDVD